MAYCTLYNKKHNYTRKQEGGGQYYINDMGRTPHKRYALSYSPRLVIPDICSEVEVRRCRFSATVPLGPAPVPLTALPIPTAPIRDALSPELDADRGRVVVDDANLGSPAPPPLRDPLLGAPDARFLYVRPASAITATESADRNSPLLDHVCLERKRPYHSVQFLGGRSGDANSQNTRHSHRTNHTHCLRVQRN
jgi:hypothetical protein